MKQIVLAMCINKLFMIVKNQYIWYYYNCYIYGRRSIIACARRRFSIASHLRRLYVWLRPADMKNVVVSKATLGCPAQPLWQRLKTINRNEM